MSYVRDNGLARARKRRERRAMTILGLCALLVIGSIVFAATFMSKPSTKSGPCPSGTVSTAPDPRALFVLDVYNAGGPKGAATAAGDAFRTHGFQLGVVGNDPYRRDVKGAGEIRFGPEGASRAKQYVAPLVPGATLVEDGRDGKSVDVAVGPEFPTIATGSVATESDPTPRCK